MSKKQKRVHPAHYVIFFIFLAIVNCGAVLIILGGADDAFITSDSSQWWWQLISALGASIGLPIIDAASGWSSLTYSDTRVDTSGAEWLYEEMLLYFIAAITIVAIYGQTGNLVSTLISLVVLQAGPWIAVALSRSRY